ncbi:3366_t:CDS:2, partial [Funneliformis geosporum]
AFNSRGFFYYLDAGNGGDVIRIGNSGEEKFKHWFETYTDKNPYEIYGDCDISKKFWGFSRLPRDKAKLELANLFKNASKVFGRDGNDKSFLNQDAFEFLKIATGHEPLSISYQVGEEFFLKDFENDVDKIGDDIVVEQRVVEGNNNPSKVNLNDFSSSRMHGSTGGNPFNDLDVIRNTIDKNYPMDDVCRNKNDRKNYGQRRNEIIELDLSGATGDVSQCSKLKLLDCNNNKKHFTSLNLNLHSNITELICRSNNLTNLNFLNNLSSKKLEKLYLNNNNFPRQDLSVFSKFNNLKELVLEKLGISNTDISHGLEYLSDSVRNIDCSFEVINKKLPLLISPLLPPQLISGIKEEENFPEKSSSDFSCREVNYEEIDSKAMEKSERGITNSANKALNKALEALKIINEKKNQELRKQNLNITDEELEKSDIKYL